MNTEKLQKELLERQISMQKEINCKDIETKENIHTVAGVDLAYWSDDSGSEQAVCCIVLIDYQTHEIIETQSYSDKVQYPYMPGFLAFRELPLVLETVKLLQHKPDIYIFDGNGYLHPRHMGIATHASLYLNTPTIGIAKTYYKVDNTDYTEPENKRGSYTDIVINGEVYGRVLRTMADVKPVFVSIGNCISLDTATEIAINLTSKESHIPVPTRYADLETHRMRKILHEKQYNLIT